MPAPPLPIDGERTRYSPANKKHQDLRPRPLRLRRNHSDDEEAETSFFDMLQTDPDKLSTRQKVNTACPTDKTPPSKENANPYAEEGHRDTWYDSGTDGCREIGAKGSSIFDNNETNNRDTGTSTPTQRGTDVGVCASILETDNGPILGVSSPTSSGIRSASKPSPFSTLRRKVSSVFTKECLDEASDSTLPPPVTKTVERTTFLGSVNEMPIIDPISTPTRKRPTRKASSSKALPGGIEGRPGYYSPGEMTSPPSTPMSKPTTWRPFSIPEGLEKSRSSHRSSSATNKEQSLEFEVIDESKNMTPPTKIPKSFPSATPTKSQKSSEVPLTIYTDKSTSDITTDLANGKHNWRSEQSENSLDSEVPRNIPQQPVSSNSSDIVSSKEGHQNIRQTFFFEDFHANDLLIQAKAEANKTNAASLEKSSMQVNAKQDEGEDQTEAISDDHHEQSEHPITKEIPTISHGKGKAIPNNSEMDEATRQKQVALKEEWDRNAEAARQIEHTPEYLALRVSLLYVFSELSFTDQVRCLARPSAQDDFYRDCLPLPDRFAP